MKNVIIEDETFIARDLNLHYPINEINSYPMVEVVLRVNLSQEYRVLDEFPGEDVVQNKDGSFTVKMSHVEDEWLYGYILSFGPSATVLKPIRILWDIYYK